MPTIKPEQIAVKKASGWKPNQYLTNMSMAYFETSSFAARRLFPVCPVQLSSSFYYTFDKEDLARDNVQRKPAYGKVQPAVMGLSDNTYSCKVDQIIVGIDEIITLNFQRAGAPGVADPRRAKVKYAIEQMDLHLELEFARKYFNEGTWANEWKGADNTSIANQEFAKFDNTDSDPVEFFDKRITDIKRLGRRRPNKLALGMETFTALKNCPSIVDRIKYTGTSMNPAVVNESVLAQCFGVEEVVVLDATYNAAPKGQPADMKYICDSKGALLMYTTDSPVIDEPSAGYIFCWDFLGNGNHVAFDQWKSNDGTHTEFLEGLIATDIKKCADDLAIYFSNCVS